MNTYEIEVTIIKSGKVSFKNVSVTAKSIATAKILAVRVVRNEEDHKAIVEAY